MERLLAIKERQAIVDHVILKQTKQNRNSEAGKRAHAKNPDHWKHAELYGMASETWRIANESFAKTAYKQAGETYSSRVKAGIRVSTWTGKQLPKEVKDKISDSRIRYLESHPNHGLAWFEVNGIKVQGTWEKKFAEYLISRKLPWARPRLIFQETRKYTPDFHCINEDVYFEVKGFLRDRDLYKMYLVLDEYPEIQIKLIEREQLSSLGQIDIFALPNFQDVYSRSAIDETKFINVWKKTP